MLRPMSIDRATPLHSRVRGFGVTIFTEMTRLALEHRAVNLAQGFPDFPGPDFVKDAAVAAIRDDRNQYARMAGELVLVEAIARDLSQRHGLTYDPMTEVCVTSGATEAIHDALLALCGPGDQVLMLDPSYDSYRACCLLAGAEPRTIPLRAPEFTWDEAEVRAAFTAKTRVLLLNSPHNPTGRALSREELELLAQLCVEHDVVCVADEVYDRLVYEGAHIPIATWPRMRERTLTLNSSAKTFSLTGWKIGWASGPAELVRGLASVHQFVTFAVATPLQHAIAQALGAPQTYFDGLRADYLARRDLLTSALAAVGFRVQPPEGAYFVMADIAPLTDEDDVAFCRRLVTEIGVAVVPATALYADPATGARLGRKLVRFAFCKRLETLRAAIERLGKLRR